MDEETKKGTVGFMLHCSCSFSFECRLETHRLICRTIETKYQALNTRNYSNYLHMALHLKSFIPAYAHFPFACIWIFYHTRVNMFVEA